MAWLRGSGLVGSEAFWFAVEGFSACISIYIYICIFVHILEVPTSAVLEQGMMVYSVCIFGTLNSGDPH